jgi:hypothetical protein
MTGLRLERFKSVRPSRSVGSASICAFATLVVMLAATCASAASEPITEMLAPTGSRAETLWIFDADFEDFTGDNDGWVSEDRSDYPYRVNYWHKDTIRINGFEHLGDSTWWCGTYNDCWVQPRGYGNDWECSLEREFPMVAEMTEPGDQLTLSYDQRYAIEKDYDYGYIEVSTDGGLTWTTIHGVTDSGFMETPGYSEDWDSDFWANPGHMELDLSDYAGEIISIRFRFTSDVYYSSEDRENNPPLNTCLDGAWQLDNISLWAFTAQAGSVRVFWDDCEDAGDNGWVHDDLEPEGQTGVVFERQYMSFPGHSGWMMVATDSMGAMVDGQDSRLRSPPIDIDGAPEVAVVSTGWLDLGTTGEDRARMYVYGAQDSSCLWNGGVFTGWWESSGGPAWVTEECSTEYLVDQSWLGLNFRLYNWHSIVTGHGVGFALDRVRVGVPMGTSVPEDEVLANEIRAIHPNPFNPQTTVEFTVAHKGRVAVRVYDVAGRLLRTLEDKSIEPGEHATSWDGTDDSGVRVASGVYFVRLEAAGKQRSQKLVLLK